MTEKHLIELGPPRLGEDEKQALSEVIDGGWITMGDRVARFESAFGTMHGCEHAVAVNSATAALQLSLLALDIGPGDEVLVPSMTFVATVNTILHARATPVFVDIESLARPHMSVSDARAKLTEKTRAIMLMHYGGYMIDMDLWRRFADENRLLLIEDAAHAAGMREAGPQSDAAAFSFFANKNMTTAEGGMVILKDAGVADRVRKMRSHGMTSVTLDRVKGRAVSYDVVECGFNFRMDEMRAALGLVQLRELPEWNQKRVEISNLYRQLLAEKDSPVEVPFSHGHPSSGHIMPVVLPAGTDRLKVIDHLKAEKIQSSIHYPPVHTFTYFQQHMTVGTLPATEEFGARQLTLPLHPRLSRSDVERVVSALNASLVESLPIAATT